MSRKCRAAIEIVITVDAALHRSKREGHERGDLGISREDASDLRELVARRTVDLLLNGKRPLDGVLKGSEDISELLNELIDGVAEGAGRYLETDAGSRLRRNGRLGVILERLGMSPRSGGKSLIANRVEAAVRERFNKANTHE